MRSPRLSEPRSAFSLLWLVALAAALWPGFATASEPPAGVAPGDGSEFLEVGDRCPTFSWTAVAGARGYELRAYAVAELQADDAEPVFAVRLPAGASSWTPSTGRCLERGERYAWSLRALGDGPTEWSEALLFEVASEPADLAEGLDSTRLQLGGEEDSVTGSDEADADRRRASRSADRDAGDGAPRRAVSPGGGVVSAITGLRAHLSQPTGLTYGVLGIVDSPDGAGVRADNDGGGPDLVLGGTTVAELSETGLSRESATDVTFNIANPGPGSMTLLVDGSPVLTTVGDPWVDETGDTMSGTLTLSPGAGNALVTTAGRVGILTSMPSEELDVAGDIAQSGALYQGGQRVLHTPGGGGSNVGVGPEALNPATTGIENAAVGLSALQSNTTGSLNAALGYGALAGNTSGGANVAVGSYALDANQVGTYNTALGARALGSATTGSNNIGVGAYGGHDLVGSNNIAIGHLGLAADSGVIRIGAAPTHTKAFVAGISGTTLAGPFSPVVVDASGQLGVATGSGVGNADTLDSIDSSQFLRTDIDDTKTAMLSLTGTGDFALSLGPTSHVNLGIGTLVFKDEALFLHDKGTRNLAVGNAALKNLTIGAHDTAFGYRAAYSTTTGANNTAFGQRALYANTSGAYNTATGSDALRANTDGIRNTANGFQALQLNTTGDNNTATGYRALASNTGGLFNTATGVSALQANTTGSSNTAVGQSALLGNTSGQSNTAVGFLGLATNITGQRNTAVGRSALLANTTASGNTAVGAYALDSNTSGAANTALGSQALESVTASGGLTAVGAFALQDNTTGSGNTAIGLASLANNTTGINNTAVGRYSLIDNTSGVANTAIGAGALGDNLSGSGNTAIGYGALASSTTGGNTAVGALALVSNTTGDSNTALGHHAMNDNLGGARNVALGWSTLSANTEGDSNTAVGWIALDSNVAGSNNTAVGTGALEDATSASYNSAVGAWALSRTTTGRSNTAFGAYAMVANATGSWNVAMGFDALLNAEDGDENVAVGHQAMESAGDGTENAALGSGALFDATGDGNVAIGADALADLGAGNNNVAIGRGAGLGLDSGSNNIFMGVTEPISASEASGSNQIVIGNLNHLKTTIHGIWGQQILNDTATVMINEFGELGTTTSSRRFKEEIADLGEWSERLLELRPVSFRYKAKPTDGGRERPLEFGLIAEEVAEVFPELVIWDGDGQPRTVKYHLLVPLLLGVVQRQQQVVERQQQVIERQESALAEQAGRYADLEEQLAEIRQALARLAAGQQTETVPTAARETFGANR